MASDWQEVTTAFVEPDLAGAAGGYLWATIVVPKVVLAGGTILKDFRQRYALTAGVAKQSDGTALMLPITEDANPEDTPIFFELQDANGRTTPIGYAVFPRPAGSDPYTAVLLSDYLTVN